MIEGKLSKLLFLLMYLVLGIRTGICQSGLLFTMPTISSPVPVSPNAASLGQYGEIPVGFYTGIPEVNVPIYNINTGSLKMPISLSYHGGGIKVEEIASWVGLGWSLNAGGMITRQQRGIPDETPGGGYLYDYSTVDSVIYQNISPAGEINLFQQIQAGTRDGEQDVFFYNLGGESGRFIFDSSGSVVPVNATRDLFQFGTFKGVANSWKVTDMNGVQYFFTALETTINIQVRNGNLSGASPSSTSGWYLTEIMNPQNTDSITFVYEPSLIHMNNSVAQTVYMLGSGVGGCSAKSPDATYNSSYTAGWRLKEIDFKNGKLDFLTSSQARCDLQSDSALSAIQIFNNNGTLNKTYQLYQSYTSSSGILPCDTTTEENNRLFLDSISIADANGDSAGKYRFVYNSAVLPSRLSYSQDYWGYFNGAANGDLFVPTVVMPGNPSYSGADRNPNSDYNQGGLLTEILYPTGGHTTFQYESNTVSNNAATTATATKSAGFLFYLYPGQTVLDTTFTISDSYGGLSGVYANITVNNGGGNCAKGESLGCPMASFTGPSGGGNIFTNTTQYLVDGTYQVHLSVLGVTDSSVIQDFALQISWQYDTTYTSIDNDQIAGGVRVKAITDYTNDTTVSSVKKYSYLFPDSTDYSSGFALGFPTYYGAVSIYEDNLAECQYSTYSSTSNYPLSSTQSSYVGYKYVEETLGSSGQFGKNVYTYEAPDANQDIGSSSFPFTPMESRDWERGQLLHLQSYRYDSSTGNYDLIYEKYNKYSYLTTNIYQSLKVARQLFYNTTLTQDCGCILDFADAQYGTETGWAILDSTVEFTYDEDNLSNFNRKATGYAYSNIDFQPVSIGTTNSNGDTVITNMNYPADFTGLTATDSLTAGIIALQNSNILTPVIEKYTQKKLPSGTPIGVLGSVLTSYKPSNLMPDTIWATQYAAPSTSFNPLNVSSGALAKDPTYLPQIMHDRYDAYPNVIQQHKVDDGFQSYLWDYNGTYPICQVINAATSDIAYTSFEADGTGNWTIGAGSVDSTTAITGTKSYILSSGSSITKSGLNSSTTYIVSYWSKVGAFSIAGTISGYPVQGKTETINNNSWTLYVHKVTGQSTIAVSGSGHIDELRLYPAAAQMTTYTYLPLVGMTSQTDVGNRVTYYEYDGLGRLKRIRDQDYNILKTFQYQYQTPGGCGNGCSLLAMQTFLGTNTPDYPVGVFDIHGTLIGNATGASNYVSLWNTDTADSRIGTLAVGPDSVHFGLSVNSGQTPPASVTGCRYYQYDLPWNELDGVSWNNGTYVDFGDGSRMHLPLTDNIGDTLYTLAPNTTRTGFYDQYDQVWWFIHYYSDTSLKTITLYHNEVAFYVGLDNGTSPATSLTKVENLRGNFPQAVQQIGGSCYQQASALTVANIANWSSISSVTGFWAHCGDGVNPSLNLNYAQDFMANNRNLQLINTTNLYLYQSGYWDSTFKLTRLKSNWNTYFTNLQNIEICDAHWNREDLSALTQLNEFCLVPDNQNHSNNSTNNALIPIPDSVIDNILIQIAAGAGQNVMDGVIWILTGGSGRSSASNAAVATLDAKGWLVYIDNLQQ
jgi:YD repeat-containing protein